MIIFKILVFCVLVALFPLAQAKSRDFHPLKKEDIDKLFDLAFGSNTLNADSVKTVSNLAFLLNLRDIIQSENDYYYALKYSFCADIEHVFLRLLNWHKPFPSVTMFHVDFFLLILMAQQEDALKKQALVYKLFSNDLRSPQNTALELSPIDFPQFRHRIGTLSLVSLYEYLKYAFSHPNLIFQLYPFCRTYFYSIRGLLENMSREAELPPINSLFTAFDYIIGEFDKFPLFAVEKASLEIISKLTLGGSFHSRDALIIRLERAFANFFSSLDEFDPTLICNCNLTFRPLWNGFYSAFLAREEFESTFMTLIFFVAKIFRGNSLVMISTLRKIFRSNLLMKEPLKLYAFVEKFILRLLNFAVKEFNRLEITNYFESPEEDNFLMELVPEVIVQMVEIYGVASDDSFAEALKMTSILVYEDGGVNCLVLWILAHVPVLFSRLNPSIISKTTIVELFSLSRYLFPVNHFIWSSNTTGSFQKLLFSLFDLKTVALPVLLESPVWNLQAIQVFFENIRAESDFEIIQTLSEEVQLKRQVIIVKETINQSTKYICFEIYRRVSGQYHGILELKGIISIY